MPETLAATGAAVSSFFSAAAPAVAASVPADLAGAAAVTLPDVFVSAPAVVDTGLGDILGGAALASGVGAVGSALTSGVGAVGSALNPIGSANAAQLFGQNVPDLNLPTVSPNIAPTTPSTALPSSPAPSSTEVAPGAGSPAPGPAPGAAGTAAPPNIPTDPATTGNFANFTPPPNTPDTFDTANLPGTPSSQLVNPGVSPGSAAPPPGAPTDIAAPASPAAPPPTVTPAAPAAAPGAPTTATGSALPGSDLAGPATPQTATVPAAATPGTPGSSLTIDDAGLQPSASDHSFLSGIENYLSQPKNLVPLAIGGAGLGLSALLQPKFPSVSSEIGPLESQASQLNQQGQTLQSYLQTGTLPPGVQAGINQATQQAQAAITSKYAALGGGAENSSAAIEDRQNVALTAEQEGTNIALSLLQQGISETQLAEGIYTQLLNSTLASDQQLGAAIGNFASAAVPRTVVTTTAASGSA